jgi:hypothetical protein
MPLFLVTGKNAIVPFLKLQNQLANLARRILEIIVHNYSAVAGTIKKAGHNRVVLSHIARQVNKFYPRSAQRQAPAYLGRVVGGTAIVYQDDFQVVGSAKFCSESFDEGPDGS